MTDILIHPSSRSIGHTGDRRAKLAVPFVIRARELQGCAYPIQGKLLGEQVEVRMPMGPVDKSAFGRVIRHDVAETGILLVLLADGNVVVVRGNEGSTLDAAKLLRLRKKPNGADEAGDDESGREGDEDDPGAAGNENETGEGGGDGGGEAALALDDGEGYGWDVGKPLEESLRAALSYVNSVVAELGPKMVVLDGSTHPAAFLPLTGRLHGGMWAGWVQDAEQRWTAFIDQRGIVAVVEDGKMPAFFKRSVSHYPLALRRRAAPVKSIEIGGMKVDIDRPFGSVHEGTGIDGKPYMVVQRCDYGYFPGSMGGDGEEFDCYVGPNHASTKVFVARQVHPSNGLHNELKAFVGFDSMEEARDMMLAHIHPKMYGGMGHMTLDAFKKALDTHLARTDAADVFVPHTEEDKAEHKAVMDIAVHLGLPSDQFNLPLPGDKTNFPNPGDNKTISLRNSDHARLPLDEMADLTGPYRPMMKDSELPTGAHMDVLHRLSRTGTARTDAEICAVRAREIYGDQMLASDPPTDRKAILRMASFGLVHPMGLEAMQAQLKEMKQAFADENGVTSASGAVLGFGGIGGDWCWFPGMPPMQPTWTPMAAEAPATAAIDPGPPNPTPLFPKDADASSIQGTPLIGSGNGTATESTGEGEDSPAPATVPPPSSGPDSNSADPPPSDSNGPDSDYPNGQADSSQFGHDGPRQEIPIAEVPPLPVPDRAAASPAPPAPAAPSEDPADPGPMSTSFRQPTSRSTMSHDRLEALVRYAAAIALVSPGHRDAAERGALVQLLQGEPGRAPAGVPGRAQGAAPAVPGRKAPGARVPDTLSVHDKRYCSATVQVKRRKDVGEPEDGTYLFIASTATIDSYGESVEQTWDFSRYEKNPVILFAHNSHDLPIGRAVSWEVKDGALFIRIRFSEKNPLAVLVREMIDEDMIRAGSVGFMPGEIATETIAGERRTVLKQNLLHEYSICAVPANPDALYVDEKMLEALEARMTRAFSDVLRTASVGDMHPDILVQHLRATLAGAAASPHAPPPAPAAPPPAAPPTPPPAVTKEAVPYKAYPPKETDTWDGDAAEKRCRAFCSSDGSGDADKMDWKLYASLFAHVDDGSEEKFGGHKLLHHDVIGGKIVTSKAGVLAAGNVLQGGRGGVDIPEDEEPKVKAHIAKHYKQFELVAPWERDEEKSKHRVPTPKTGVHAMGDQQIHRTDTPAAETALRQRGQLTISCSHCGTDHLVDLTPTKARITALETRVTEAENAAALATSDREKANTERDTFKRERDKAVSELTKVELSSLIGTELWELSPAEAEDLAQLRVANPEVYAKQLKTAKDRHTRGKAKADAEARARGADPGQAANPGASAAPAPITRGADPTPPVAQTEVPPAGAPGAAPPGAAPQGDTAEAAMKRMQDRAGAALGIPAA